MKFDPETDAPPPEDRGGFDPLPLAWYHAAIIGAEAVMPRNPESPAGEMLKLQVEIDGNEHPQYASRQVFAYLCINHETSDQARNIARRNLAAICHAIDLAAMDDPAQLIGEKLMVKLKVKPANGDYEAGNEISSYAAWGSEKTAEGPKKAAAGRGNGREESTSKPKPGGWRNR